MPTFQEAGLPEMEAGAWFAFFAPAGTPRTAIDWLNREANAVFTAPDVSARFTAAGMELPLGPPESLGAHVEAETKRWGEVIRRAGIKLHNRVANKKAGPPRDSPAFVFVVVYCFPASSGVMRRTVTRRFSSFGPCTGTLSCDSP